MAAHPAGDSPGDPGAAGHHAWRSTKPSRLTVAAIVVVTMAAAVAAATVRHSAGAGPSGRRASSFAKPPGSTPGPSITQESPGLLTGVERRTVDGDFVVKTDGQSVSNLTVTGTLYVIASNVTVTNVLAPSIALNAAPGGNYSVVVKHSMTLRHVQARSVTNIGGNHITITDSVIGNGQTGTAIQFTNNVQPDGTYMPCDYVDIEHNVVAGLGHVAPGAGVHSEAVHLMGVRHAIIRDNVLDWTAPDAGTWAQISAVVFLQGWNKVPITDAVVDHNKISGGGFYATYMGGVGNVLTNNTFHRVDPRTAPVYPLNPGETLRRSGNVLNGQSIG